MKAVPLPADEDRRLAELREYQLLDSPPEDLFDVFARLAAQICDVPIGLLTLIDAGREYVKANVGLDETREIPRKWSLCAEAFAGTAPPAESVEIADAAHDARTRTNPLVTGDPHLRFYAAVPLRGDDGTVLGALAVIDRVPRVLDDVQRAALRDLAAGVTEQFEARRALLRLFDSSSTELYQIDLAERRLFFASQAARANLQYGLDEIVALPLETIFPSIGGAADFARYVAALHDAPDGRRTFGTTAQRRDGTTYPIELRVQLVRGHRHEYALVFGADLTDRQRANERISLLSAAMEAAQDPVLITTPGEGPDEPSVIVYANEAFVRQKGTRREDVIGRSSAMFHGALTDRATLAKMREALLAGLSHRVEYITYRADGTHYHTELAGRPLRDESGRVAYFVVVHRDVTEKVKREARLRAQNERLTALTALARDLFGTLDGRAFVAALLRGTRDLLTSDARLLARRPDGGYATTSDLFASDGDPFDDPFVRWTASSDVPLVHDSQRRAAVRIAATGGAIAYVLDVERDTAFEEADLFALGLLGQYVAVGVRNAELYAEIADRRAAVIELNQVKNDLIAMLAHDFKGPLTTIVGFADVLAEDERVDAESRTYLEMISSSATRLASLASDTLALSRMEQNEITLQSERVDLVALVRDVVRVFTVTRAIDLRTDRDAIEVVCDAPRLRQVFENLVGNAIKYSPGGQPVEVFVRLRGRTVEVAVRDRGIGIPERDRSRLFGRFARATNARQLGIAGTGFGLYLARTIVEGHGGTIGVDSSEGLGSTFRVTIPLEPAANAGPRRVLLHEPDGDARSYVAHALREDGLAVTVATSGRETLEALDGGRFDVAVIDVERLERPEAEFVAAVAQRVALVRLGSSDDIAGWDAWLTKPVLGRDLRAAMATALARHAARQAPPAAPETRATSGERSRSSRSAAGSS